MPCELVKFAGGFAIACSRGRRRNWCEFCRERPATRLCDHPTADGKTCDRAICDECATRVASNVDYCPEHRKAKKQGELFA